MITSKECIIETSLGTPFTNPLIRYDEETAVWPATSQTTPVTRPVARAALHQALFLSALALAEPAIPLNSVTGGSSSQRIVRYTFSRPQAIKLSIREARLLALAVHEETESLLEADRLGEARRFLDLNPEADG